MAASILNSDSAVNASIYVVRAFIKIREFILKNNKLFGNKVMGYITPLTMEIDSKAELSYMNSRENN